MKEVFAMKMDYLKKIQTYREGTKYKVGNTKLQEWLVEKQQKVWKGKN
jgi:hypothetical protein